MSIKDQFREALAPYREAFDQRWEKMPPTDRLVWAGIAGVSVVVVVVFGIWLPSHRAVTTVREQYEGNLSLLSYIQANASRVQSANSGAEAAGGGALLGIISDSAASSGLTLRRFEPEGEHVHIWLEGVNFNKLAGWLDQLSKQGITASKAEVERQQDGLTVTANLTLGR